MRRTAPEILAFVAATVPYRDDASTPAGASAPVSLPVDSGAAIVELTHVGRRFGARWVLRAIDLRIGPGERIALLGESGSGKSTLLNVVAGLEPADAGSVRLCGVPVDGTDPDRSAALRARCVGFVFQAFLLLPHLDLAANVEVPLLIAGTPPRRARERSHELLARVGLAGRARDMPRQLSGGEQQRVALARALATRPALVIADEPTGSLDPETAERMLALIDAEIRASGAALLMATHSARAAAIAPRRLRLAWREDDDGGGARLTDESIAPPAPGSHGAPGAP